MLQVRSQVICQRVGVQSPRKNRFYLDAFIFVKWLVLFDIVFVGVRIIYDALNRETCDLIMAALQHKLSWKSVSKYASSKKSKKLLKAITCWDFRYESFFLLCARRVGSVSRDVDVHRDENSGMTCIQTWTSICRRLDPGKAVPGVLFQNEQGYIHVLQERRRPRAHALSREWNQTETPVLGQPGCTTLRDIDDKTLLRSCLSKILCSHALRADREGRFLSVLGVVLLPLSCTSFF